MIRRIANIAAAMMVRVVRVAHRNLNDRRGFLRGAKACARGVARAQEERGYRQKHLPCGAEHGR